MRIFLSRFFATITGRPRYFPDFEWDTNSVVFNVFRLYESIFGRDFEIKAEMSSVAEKDKEGNVIIFHAYHSWESLFVFCEQQVKELFSFHFIPFKIYIPLLRTPQGVPMFASPYLFAIAVDTTSVGQANSSLTLTVAHTITGSNTILQSGTYVDDMLQTVSSQTYNLNVMNKALTLSTLQGRNSFIYNYANGTGSGGALNIVVTASGLERIGMSASSYSGCAQTTTPDSSNTNSSSSTTALTTSTTVVAASCWLFGFASAGRTVSAGAGTTLRQINTDNSLGIFDSNGTVGTGSQSLVVNLSSANAIDFAMLSFAPFTASPVTNRVSLLGLLGIGT